ncbi:MFS transporter [Streptomyces sp. NPDC046197]|uniref:MFS transporter n=1 Tax=Streptomyces sp. NPDC046197 TaxID=3154337 RepID=UPI0033E15C90
MACTAYFLVLFDASVMTVALPSIQTGLGFAPAGLQWVVSSYTLAFAGLLILGGRLADLYGPTRVFLGGLAVFTASGLIGGLAADPAMLIAARAAQGVGAAVLAPLSLTLLTTTFAEGPRRTRALTAWAAVGLTAGAAGNLFGGVLTEYLSWRSVLLVNVPIGVPALLFAARIRIPGANPGRKARLDLPGAVLATAALTLLTLGVCEAHMQGWSDPDTALPLAAGVGALVAFVVVETRVAAPLMPPGLFRLPGIGRGNVAMLLAGASQVPTWYFLTLTMQDVLGYSAAQAGAGFVPHAAVMLLVGLGLIPRLMRRVQARVLIAAGALIAAVGYWWQSHITPESGYVTGILGPAVAISCGGGLVSTPLTTTVTSGVGAQDAGAASGLLNTTRQFGGAFGLALVLTLTTSGTSGTPAALADAYGNAFRAIALIMVALAALTPLLPALGDARGAGPALPNEPPAARTDRASL